MRGFARLAVIAAAGAAGACLASPVFAATSAWEHDGSRVTLKENGEKRTITFVRPKASLRKAGVRNGTVLFDGKVKKDGRVSGYAKIFKAGCEPVDYFVEGTINSAGGKIVLQGQAPVYSGKDCRIKGYSEDSKDSMLVFRGRRGGGTYARNQPSKRDDGNEDARGRRKQRDSRRGDSASASPDRGQRDDAYVDRQYGSDGQYDDRRYDDRQYDRGGYSDGDNAQADDRRRRSDRQYDDEYYGADDEEYTTYRDRTYRRRYERPYQPWWRYGQ